MTPDTAPRERAAQRRLPAPVAEAVAARRDSLHAAALRLEGELDALGSQPRPDVARTRAALQSMRATLRAHAEGAEASDGPLVDLTDAAPWLARRASHQRDEHRELLQEATALVDRLGEGEDPAPVLDEVRQLLERVAVHRHRATTLLQDAYMLDIPEGD